MSPQVFVEAEIGSGDLKPARFANIFVIPADRAGPIIKAIDDIRDAIDEAKKKAGWDTERQVIEQQCLIGLTQVGIAMLKASADAGGNPETAQNLFQLNANEEGRFTLAGVRSEKNRNHRDIGKVGMNLAAWISDPITMKGSAEIKAHSARSFLLRQGRCGPIE